MENIDTEEIVENEENLLSNPIEVIVEKQKLIKELKVKILRGLNN